MAEERKLKLCFLASIEDNHTRKWIKYFVGQGHEIHWISLPSKHIDEVRSENVKIYLIKDFHSKPLDVIFNWLFVRRLIRKINPDFLHAHYVGVNGILGALSGFHPFVLTAYGSDILISPKSMAARNFVKFALKSADLITCDGENSVKAMTDLGANSNKIKLIYFGVDAKKFCPGKRDELLERKLGVANHPVVISLRSFEPVYNIETLIKAIPLVLREVPEAKFIVAGKGSQEERIKNMSKSLEVAQSIIFPGWISAEELPRYLRTADVYVSTSLSDGGISMSTSEAMVCGLPAVVTDFGDNKKWIQDGENGFIFPMKDSKVLAEKIVCLLKDKSCREKFGRISRQVIESRNNYYKEMAKMEEIYNNFNNKQL